MNFTVQETLQDAIVAHKFLMHMYCQYGIECSNQQLRDLFASLHNVASAHDLKIFKLMNEKGYYPTTPAPATQLKQTIKMHTNMQEKLKQKIDNEK